MHHTLSTSVMGVLQVAFQALSSSFSSSSARRFFATLEKIKTWLINCKIELKNVDRFIGKRLMGVLSRPELETSSAFDTKYCLFFMSLTPDRSVSQPKFLFKYLTNNHYLFYFSYLLERQAEKWSPAETFFSLFKHAIKVWGFIRKHTQEGS